MPIYEYERADGSVFEIIQKISDQVLTVCPTTGQTVERLISQNAFHLKGAGWYKTDYAAKGPATAKNATTPGASESEGGSSTVTDSGGSTTAEPSTTPTPSETTSSTPSTSGGCGSACGCH